MFTLPRPLSGLALDALGTLVSNLTVRLAAVCLYDCGSHSLELAASRLEQLIQEMVPPNLASEVTEKLLSSVLNTFDELIFNSYMRQDGFVPYTERCNFSGLVALRVATATIHPSVTSFNYNRDYEGLLSSSYVRKFMLGYLEKVFLSLKRLRVLKLRMVEFDKALILEGSVSLENLQEFSYNFCSDDILQVLSNSCRCLKSLDVRESKKVTSASVNFLLKFRELRCLKINNTSITTEGVANLIKGVPQEQFPSEARRLDLRVFKSNFTASQVEMLPECLPNLISLEMYFTEECSLASLSRLRCLKYLGLCRFGFPDIPDFHFLHAEVLLREIGGQLEKLKLINLNGTDLRVVKETCRSLKTLVLQFPDTRRLGFPEGLSVVFYAERYALPEFQTVSCFDVKIRNCNLTEYLLTRLVNLKQLRLWWLYNSSESLLTCLVSALEEGRLQELEIRENRIRICGCHAIVSNVNGSTIVTEVGRLRDVIWKVFMGVNIKYAVSVKHL